MNIRDLKPHQLKRLATECDEEYNKQETATNNWKHFGTNEPMTPKDIWRLAYSRATSAVLRRVDNLRD